MVSVAAIVPAKTSLDINGRDGAVEVDLSRPLNTSLRVLGMCDVVTNFGTTEHVGESDYVEADVDLLDIWSSQYEAFRNLHRLARRDGLIINMVPAAGCWPRHGAVEYEPRFFEALANATGYEIMNLSLHRPSYYWTTDETSFFWDLLQKLLARESLQLPASVDPEDMFIMPHMNKALGRAQVGCAVALSHGQESWARSRLFSGSRADDFNQGLRYF